MSKPLFEDYYSITTRRNRMSFFINIVLLWLAFIIGFFALISATDVETQSGLFRVVAVSIGFMLLFVAAKAMLVVQRGNDLGLRRDLVAAAMLAPLLTLTIDLHETGIAWHFGVTDALIPHETTAMIVNVAISAAAAVMLVILIFMPGQAGANKWGDDPLS